MLVRNLPRHSSVTTSTRQRQSYVHNPYRSKKQTASVTLQASANAPSGGNSLFGCAPSWRHLSITTLHLAALICRANDPPLICPWACVPSWEHSWSLLMLLMLCPGGASSSTQSVAPKGHERGRRRQPHSMSRYRGLRLLKTTRLGNLHMLRRNAFTPCMQDAASSASQTQPARITNLETARFGRIKRLKRYIQQVGQCGLVHRCCPPQQSAFT